MADVEVNSTSYISSCEMHMTYHQYRGDSLRILNVKEDEQEEVEKTSDWEILTLGEGTSRAASTGSKLVASSVPSEEEIEWANDRMMALRIYQCPDHPDDSIKNETSGLQAMLDQPSWSRPMVCRAEPEYLDGVEEILEKLEEPLRAYNMDPSEARANLETWKEPLAKELGVVSKGLSKIGGVLEGRI